MGNKMDLNNCKRKGNIDTEPGQIKMRPTHLLEEEKKDNDIIPE